MMSEERSSLPSNRRSWIRTSACVAAAVALPKPAFSAGGLEEPLPSWIDAHVHVWPAVTNDYPLAPDFNADAVQPESFTPDQLFRHCRPCGVERIVLIQMNFFGFDNRYMLDAIQRDPGVFSGVAVIDHEQPSLRNTMTKLREQGVRGYRLYATADQVEAWQSSPAIAAMFRNGADLGQAMCMLSDPESLAGIELLCSRNPETTVVIDHFSRIGMRKLPSEEELNALCRLARFPKVYVKTSAFYALGRKKPPYIDLVPMIHRLLESFGSSRLMWASDCPYQVQSPHTYEASIALVRDHLDKITPDDRQNLLRNTAERVFFS
ncbi:MAG: amidohydrolase family protein [Planctomycetota bacterium]|jgi:predicted TIM-barrel fold metal-dependent hydrolase